MRKSLFVGAATLGGAIAGLGAGSAYLRQEQSRVESHNAEVATEFLEARDSTTQTIMLAFEQTSERLKEVDEWLGESCLLLMDKSPTRSLAEIQTASECDIETNLLWQAKPLIQELKDFNDDLQWYAHDGVLDFVAKNAESAVEDAADRPYFEFFRSSDENTVIAVEVEDGQAVVERRAETLDGVDHALGLALAGIITVGAGYIANRNHHRYMNYRNDKLAHHGIADLERFLSQQPAKSDQETE